MPETADDFVTWDAPCYMCGTRPSVFNLVLGGTPGPLCLNHTLWLGLEPTPKTGPKDSAPNPEQGLG